VCAASATPKQKECEFLLEDTSRVYERNEVLRRAALHLARLFTALGWPERKPGPLYFARVDPAACGGRSANPARHTLAGRVGATHGLEALGEEFGNRRLADATRFCGKRCVDSRADEGYLDGRVRKEGG
jgi:hypothetical protein